MTSLCTRCALRLQRLSNTTNPTHFSRSVTTYPEAFTRGLPTFQPTSNPELDALLTDFRYKHFLPAALEKQQWNLIFQNKNKAFLEQNPQAVKIGDEEFQLEFLGGYGVMPNRKKQLQHVVRLLKVGEASDWENLPNLLRGLHAMGKDPPPRVRARIIRLATIKGQFHVIVRCLQSARTTGLTLKDPDTLHATIWGLRQIADQEDWSEEAVAQALRTANVLASELESEVHGGGKKAFVGKDDGRRNLFVLGVFLELNAVFAYRFKGGEDGDGRVRAFAERLLANVGEEDLKVQLSLPTEGPITPMRHYAPVLHGSKLANKMLGDAMPEKQKADALISRYEQQLGDLKNGLEARNDANLALDKPQNYDAEALRVWRDIARDI